MRRRICHKASMLAALALVPFLHANAQEGGELECGSLMNAVGPFDYYSNDPEARRLLANVEFNHFNEDVRTLRSGQTAASPMADLDYVLRAFPNHPEALMLVLRYQAEGGGTDGFRTADCYFDRALRFAPGDARVRMLYAIRLANSGKREAALKEYQTALEIAPDYIEAHYNIGLLLVELGRLDEARAHAEIAYAAGFPLDGLRRQLMRRGAWPSTQ